MQRTVSIIIPNYNGQHLLSAYLPSVIKAAEKIDLGYELLVVDDGSKDESITFIKQNYPSIKLLCNEKNSGFSYTCNHGIRHAKNELILLLNSDVRLTPDYFDHQWKYFDKQDTFGVMSRIMSADGKKIEDAARLLEYNGCRIKANKFYYLEDKSDSLTYTAYLSGANALVNAKKLKELGGFDEIFSPFSSEDFDLSLRAWQLGWKCYYEHQSVCFHQISGSTKTQIKSDLIKKIYYRNRFLLQAIHLEGTRLKLLPFYLIFLEVLPKFLSGKFWIWSSYTEYNQLNHKVRDSRQNLDILEQTHHSQINIDTLIKLIDKSIAHKSITRL